MSNSTKNSNSGVSKEDILRKLTSRKFGVVLVTLIVSILYLFNVAESTVEQISAIITNLFVVIAYLFGESSIDKARVDKGGDEQ